MSNCDAELRLLSYYWLSMIRRHWSLSALILDLSVDGREEHFSIFYHGIIGATDTDQLNIKAILASGISIPLQPFFAGLTLLIHVIVLKVHCRRTELQTSAYYTYPNAWVFTSASKSISSDRLICEESPHI